MAKKKSDLECARSHKYRVVSGGEFVPGVTTIIDVVNKPQLMWAAAGIAAESAIENGRRKKTIVKRHREWLCSDRGKTTSSELKRALGELGSDNEVYAHWARGEFNRQWRAKADRGTRVHDVAEQWARGIMLGERVEIEVLAEDEPWIDALTKFHVDYKPIFHLVECIVLNNEHRYGGRFDTIAEVRGPRASGLFMIDYKTGGKYPYEVALQAEGYWQSKLAIYNEHGVLIGGRNLPALDGALTIYLGDDASLDVSDPFENVSHEQAWRAFLACRELYAANKEITDTLGGRDND